MESIEQVIEKWKSLNVSECRFNFNCGGDSMNDTDIEFEDNDGNMINDSELSYYFDREVYNHVDFYVNSDGHYQGEQGTVHINLNEDGDDFYYMKSATSEYYETYSGFTPVELTVDEQSLIDEYIQNMGYTNWNGEFITYKKDFILTDELKDKFEALREKLQKSSYEFEYASNGDETDERSFTLIKDGDASIVYIGIDGVKHLNLYVEVNVYEYRDSD
jgi:hypothetical protein